MTGSERVAAGHRTRKARGTEMLRDEKGRWISRAGASRTARNFARILREEHPDWTLDDCGEIARMMAADEDFVSALREAGQPLKEYLDAQREQLIECFQYGTTPAWMFHARRGDYRTALQLLERRRAPIGAPVSGH